MDSVGLCSMQGRMFFRPVLRRVRVIPRNAGTELAGTERGMPRAIPQLTRWIGVLFRCPWNSAEFRGITRVPAKNTAISRCTYTYTQQKARKRHYWCGKMFVHMDECSTHTEHARACACGSFGRRLYASGIGGTCPRNYFHGYPHAHGMAEIRGIPWNITRGTVFPQKSVP